ncbi:MAG: TA system VapC family ribonuclease toxin [Acidobacteriaceae bacterium]
MIAPDANLLLYAYSPHSPHHEAAKSWLEQVLSDGEAVGFPLPTIHAFVRLLTNPISAGRTIALPAALAIVDEWLSLPHVRVLFPSDRHWQLVKRISTEGHATGNLFPDATIAAIATEYGAVVHTNDRDFARFPSVRWHNPLKP